MVEYVFTVRKLKFRHKDVVTSHEMDSLMLCDAHSVL